MNSSTLLVRKIVEKYVNEKASIKTFLFCVTFV